MTPLNTNDGTPLYLQLAKQLKCSINHQEFESGNRLPSEMELCDIYSVSRVTVRKAIEVLVSDGVLVRQRGKGTYVNRENAVLRDMAGITSFTNACRQAGKHPSARLLSLKQAALPAGVRSFFSTDEKKGIVMRRIRFADDVPVIMETNFFPASFDFLYGADLTLSLHDTLTRHGLTPNVCRETPEVCLATESESKALQVQAGKPLLLLVGRYTSENGSPLYFSKDLVVTERFKYTFTVGL